MRKIERPNYIEYLGNESPNVFSRWFENWFKDNIEGCWIVEPDDIQECFWQDNATTSYKCIHWFKEPSHTHKALLIKSSIEPIKQETCADVLKDMLDEVVSHDYSDPNEFPLSHQVYERAKKALEREG